MLLSHADALRTRLLSTSGLEGLAVHVVRRMDLRQMATEELGKKTTGAFLGIELGGWSPENEDGGEGEYWAEMRFELAFATLPHLLEERKMPVFDEMLRRIVLAVHGWRPAGLLPVYCPQRWRVGGGSYLPDETFLTYLFSATISDDWAAMT